MPPVTGDPAAIDAIPDLTLGECCSRWSLTSRNSVKARAARLGVELLRLSSTRTVWPAAHVALGDALAEHLRDGGTMANYQGPSLTPPAAVTDRPAIVARPSLTPPAAASDGLAAAVADAVLQLALALPQAAPADPLAVPRALADAAALGAWLSTRELAAMLGLSAATVRSWAAGHSPRPGFVLQRQTHRGLWWRVMRSDP